jgi:hypothetical protein
MTKEVRTPLQSIIDPFVIGISGELVCNLVGNSNPPSNADYLFPKHGVLAELKAIEAGSYIESFHRKLANLTAKWNREGKLVVMGTARVDSKNLAPECQEEMFSEMAEPIQKNIVYAANEQIKSTKKLLNMPEAKGLLWVASDGNEDLQPNIVWYLLTRILSKRKANGDPAYSSIHGIAYFNPRMLASVPKSNLPAVFFYTAFRYRIPELVSLLDLLRDAWPQYVSIGLEVPILTEVPGSPQETRFFGVSSKLPKISPNFNYMKGKRS